MARQMFLRELVKSMELEMTYLDEGTVVPNDQHL